MAAYRRVYDSHHLQADCPEPGSAPEPYALYGLPLPFSTARLEASFQSVTGGLLARQLRETRPGKLKSEAGMAEIGDGVGFSGRGSKA